MLRRLLWTIYVLFIIATSITGFFFIENVFGFVLFVFVFEGIMLVPVFLGTLFYAYKRRVFSPKVWQIYFYVFIAFFAIEYVWFFFSDTSFAQETSLATALAGEVLYLPAYIGLYLYAFKFLPSNKNSSTQNAATKV